jgi:hypothetical protein
MATADNTPRPAAVDRSEFGGLRLLVSDLRTGSLLLARARSQLLGRLFGVRPEQAAMVSLIVVAMLARRAREKTVQATHAVARPTLADAAVGGGVAKEVLHLIAGPRSREVPLGSLVALVVALKLSQPVVRRSSHAVRTGSHRAQELLMHRYGHLIRRNGRRPGISRNPLAGSAPGSSS